MADKTGIEWTDATWNPIAGCSIVSKGCTNCYAMKLVHDRLSKIPKMQAKYGGITQEVNGNAVWNGNLTFDGEMLLQPLKWKRPRRIFVNSMSDLFHEKVPVAWIHQIFAVMALSPQHQFQILTKRPQRMRDYMSYFLFNEPCAINEYVEDIAGADHIDSWSPPLKNVWVGVSVEDQKTADDRIPFLLETPAAVRFLSCEPLLGSLDILQFQKGNCIKCGGAGEAAGDYFSDDGISSCEACGGKGDDLDNEGIGWVIAGGESGSAARPMHPDWPRQLRDQCQAAGVPFFFKQWGEWAPDTLPSELQEHYELLDQWDGTCRKMGKKVAGRLLDGRTWDEMPSAKVDDRLA